MKKILSLILALCLLTSLSACGKETVVEEKLGGILQNGQALYPEEFLRFDSVKVSFTEFRYFYLNYKNMYLEEDPDHFQSEENEEALKKEVLQYLLDQYAVRFLAKENGIRLSSEDKKAIEAEMESTKTSYESEAAFEEELAKSYLSLSSYRAMLEYSSLYLKLFEHLYGENGKKQFSQEEFKAYFEENYLAVQQIYLPFGKDETKDACEATRNEAASIRSRWESGEDFWELVKKHGKDDNMLDYPDGYYITEGQAEEVLYEASKALEIGQVSQPVIGASGVYLIRRMELKELRMEENRQTALYGYYDTYNEHHPGAYDDAFYKLYREKAEKISVEYGPLWEQVSTETVV